MIDAHLRCGLRNLRHLYEQMLGGHVSDCASAARGLLGPAIEQCERAGLNHIALAVEVDRLNLEVASLRGTIADLTRLEVDGPAVVLGSLRGQLAHAVFENLAFNVRAAREINEARAARDAASERARVLEGGLREAIALMQVAEHGQDDEWYVSESALKLLRESESA